MSVMLKAGFTKENAECPMRISIRFHYFLHFTIKHFTVQILCINILAILYNNGAVSLGTMSVVHVLLTF